MSLAFLLVVAVVFIALGVLKTMKPRTLDGGAVKGNPILATLFLGIRSRPWSREADERSDRYERLNGFAITALGAALVVGCVVLLIRGESG